MEPSPAFPSAGGGLVSTIDDYLTFGQMMLNKGKHGRERILSRPSVETMTTDHLTPEQKAASGLVPATLTATVGGLACPWSPGAIMWRGLSDGSVGNGGVGTGMGPREDMVTILMTPRA
jgi:CubicO group peptidase (beta-lactamase class C family)